MVVNKEIAKLLLMIWVLGSYEAINMSHFATLLFLATYIICKHVIHVR